MVSAAATGTQVQNSSHPRGAATGMSAAESLSDAAPSFMGACLVWEAGHFVPERSLWTASMVPSYRNITAPARRVTTAGKDVQRSRAVTRAGRPVQQVSGTSRQSLLASPRYLR